MLLELILSPSVAFCLIYNFNCFYLLPIYDSDVNLVTLVWIYSGSLGYPSFLQHYLALLLEEIMLDASDTHTKPMKTMKQLAGIT